jgi:hypothetical protein
MSLVDLLVQYYLGNAQFTQEQNRALIQTVVMALNISLAFASRRLCNISFLW